MSVFLNSFFLIQFFAEIRHLGIILQLIIVAFDSVCDKESNDRSHDPVREV